MLNYITSVLSFFVTPLRLTFVVGGLIFYVLSKLFEHSFHGLTYEDAFIVCNVGLYVLFTVHLVKDLTDKQDQLFLFVLAGLLLCGVVSSSFGYSYIALVHYEWCGPGADYGDLLSLQLEWLSKGALFDLVESYDVTFDTFQPSQNKFLFNTIEFGSRMLYGLWFAYFAATLLFKIRALRNSRLVS